MVGDEIIATEQLFNKDKLNTKKTNNKMSNGLKVQFQ